MATWDELAAADPQMAAFGYERLHSAGQAIGFLATVRHDEDGPRVHPVCPILGDGRIFVSIPKRSPKNRDLQRNGRYMLHAFPANEDAEFSIRGTARLASGVDREVAQSAATFATGVRDSEDVFELDIERADSTTWENWNTADTHAIRKKWVETSSSRS